MSCDLFLSITAHGYGHAAQAGAVVRALRTCRPDLRLIVQSTLPPAFLEEVLGTGRSFEVVAEAADVGLVNRSAFEVDLPASAEAYRRFHEDWPSRVDMMTRRLEAVRPRLVLADVPYLPVAAAARAGIPAAALCSLNWADVYNHYLGHRPEAAEIRSQILDAYQSAAVFIVPEPGMAMPDLPNIRNVGPCAALGTDRRAELLRAAGGSAQDRLILVAVGGIAWEATYESWPRRPGWRWIVQTAYRPARDDMIRLADVGMRALDVVASVDAVVGKLGYSLPMEAACHGKPMLYVPRPDWPETPVVSAWMDANTIAEPTDLETFRDGNFQERLEALLAVPRRPPVAATGAMQAAAMLAEWLP